MKPSNNRVWHYVKPNETTRIPRRHVFLDTEAVMERAAGGHIQGWRLGVACFRRAIKGKRAAEYWRDFDTPEDMWRAVSGHCGRDDRTVVWAHNLSYDVRISDAFTILPSLGWRLVAHNLAPKGTWLQWRKGEASLVMVDSASIFPTTLAAIGKTVGIGKPSLPAMADSRETWLTRCRGDVRILRAAVLHYLDWLETEDLGNWQLTGAAQSWATFRHRFLSHKMLVHDDECALLAERRAMWTGRCEAYWRGTFDSENVHEWDLTLAYARIARDTPVPVRLIGPMPLDYAWLDVLDSPNVALLADVSVSTETPVVPTQHEGRILWPTGSFETTLWDVEIRAAILAGATVTIRRGWLYRTRPALQMWATWLIQHLEDESDAVPAWQRIVLKHWARALIGRMAMTYTEWEEFATTDDNAVRRSTVYDRDTKEEYEIMQVGGTIWRDTGRVEWANSMPMVTGYVQACCRVQMWNIHQALPSRTALYMDTDSLICPASAKSTVQQVADSPIGKGLRLKKTWDGIAIYGPRQIRTGTDVRVSGLPRRAIRTGRNTFQGEIWQSLAQSLRTGRPDRVIVRDREWTIQGVDHRRAGIGIGWTEPIRLERGNHDRREAARVPGSARPVRPTDRTGQRRSGAHGRPGRRDRA